MSRETEENLYFRYPVPTVIRKDIYISVPTSVIIQVTLMPTTAAVVEKACEGQENG